MIEANTTEDMYNDPEGAIASHAIGDQIKVVMGEIEKQLQEKKGLLKKILKVPDFNKKRGSTD